LLLCSSQTDVSYCDPKLDALVGRAQRATGQPARQIWQEADRRAVDQAAWVPLTNSGGIDVVGAHVGNYQHNPQLGVLLDQLWVR
jgi:ABC-type transport system substrate-binding protein